MKLPIEAVVVLLKNTIRRVFDEKLEPGIRCGSRNNIFWKFYFGSKPFGLQ